MTEQTRRIRDPIHGLVMFDEDDKTDMLAWKLIETPEFQRLRRIRQLGVSEFVFPGATHTRFAHSIGVYHNARKLMKVIRRNVGDEKFEKDRAQVVLIAALLHDLGHGPFSHAFEGARETLAQARGDEAIEKHEKFTAKLILAEGGAIRLILDRVDGELAEQVAGLIRADDPADIYHAVVSSSFDADRLDYLMRDRYMTGTQTGAIDYEWLIDNLAIDHIPIPQDDDPARWVPTFVFKLKGRQAAEDFLFARYRLYTQVYLHKTTRGFEQLISALVMRIGELSEDPERLGLDRDHPLIRFLRPDGASLSNYRDLDDAVAWGAIERFRRCRDEQARILSERLWNRKPLKVLDITSEFGQQDESKTHNALRRLGSYVDGRLGKTVFLDEAPYNLYSRAKGDVAKEHKKVRVRDADGGLKEITEFPDTVISSNLMAKSKMTRFYFLTSEDRQAAEKAMKGR